MNRIFAYFDLQSGRRDVIAAGHSSEKAPVWPQYIALAAGVILEPFLRHYIEHGEWSVTVDAVIGRVAFGLIIAVVILPSVYRASFDPGKPIIVQLAALLPMGLGWQSLFNTAVQAVT